MKPEYGQIGSNFSPSGVWAGLWSLTPFQQDFSYVVISWLSVLLVEETRIPGENHQPVASHWHT